MLDGVRTALGAVKEGVKTGVAVSVGHVAAPLLEKRMRWLTLNGHLMNDIELNIETTTREVDSRNEYLGEMATVSAMLSAVTLLLVVEGYDDSLDDERTQYHALRNTTDDHLLGMNYSVWVDVWITCAWVGMILLVSTAVVASVVRGHWSRPVA